ncbi:unnamed protein product [Paramecium octaurelia]|uniref:Transmembrane protein n=1 Tax=Paramecium octaurelia TaxID=43137 RepID=A0A8S1RY26_PAROT|nr:unnamed protein product [Paramecium octaurelia]
MDKYQVSSTARFIYEKHEQNFRNSVYTGISFFPFILLLKLIFQCTFLTLATAFITSIFYYENKYTWRYLIQIILCAASLWEIQIYCIQSHVFTFLINLILVPYWPIQVLFQLPIIRQPSHIYIFLFMITLLRAIEILKRYLYANICRMNALQQEYEGMILNLPHHILYLDENLNVLFSSKAIKLQSLSQQQVADFIQRKHVGIAQFETSEQQLIEYQVKPWENNLLLIETYFQSQDDSFFTLMNEKIIKLHALLSQDYTKWNNLRAFRMIKESDLSTLGQCLSECLDLEHYIISQIISPSQDIKLFDIKIQLCNLIECTVLKLYEHFNKIDLTFENGIPELVAGDKTLLMFILQTLLFSTRFCDKQKGELSIKCIVSQINQENSSYHLEFILIFTCTPSVIKLYSQVFGFRDAKLNLHEQFLIYCLQICKRLMKLNKNEFKFQTDGDNVIITFTFLSYIASNKQDHVSQFTDITFSRIVLNDYHYQWKEKVQILPTKFMLDSQIRKSLQATTNTQNLPEQITNKIDVNFPEIRDELILLLEITLEDAKDKGIFDQIVIDQSENNDKFAISEYADSIANSPPSFNTPQINPTKLSDLLKEKFKKRLSRAKKTKKKKKLVKNNYNVVFPRRNDSNCKSNSEPAMFNFNQDVQQNRDNRTNLKWTHRCNVIQPPKTVNEILCYVSNIKLQSDIITNFGNSTYDNFEIKNPIIVVDIVDVIRLYKEYLLAGKQFYFIMLFVKKQQEIADFTEIVQKNEQEFVQQNPKFQQTYLIGITESQLKPSFALYHLANGIRTQNKQKL